MHVSRTPTLILKMSNNFSDFHKSLLDLVKSFEEKNIMIKTEENLDENIIRIFGENISSLSKAKVGLEDVSELAYTTAEHHPYWGLLYHCSQISKLALEKWNDNLTNEELDEITWSIKELKNVCDKLKDNTNQE